MLKTKLVRFAGALALLMMLPLSAQAVTVSFNGPGVVSPQGASNMLYLQNTLTLEVGETPEAFSWSILCTGCIIEGYDYNYISPSYYPTYTEVAWTGAKNGNLGPLFGAPDVVGGPNPAPGTLVGSIGTLKIGATINGAGNTQVIGFVTVHVTAATGNVSNFLIPTVDGFSCNGGFECTWSADGVGVYDSVSWVPEPGTAMLLALGLGGLGVMGRRNRS